MKGIERHKKGEKVLRRRIQKFENKEKGVCEKGVRLEDRLQKGWGHRNCFVVAVQEKAKASEPFSGVVPSLCVLRFMSTSTLQSARSARCLLLRLPLLRHEQ
jgi:hypothetical protein